MYQQNHQKVDLLNIVSNFLNNLPFDLNNKNICVCLSGGADSVALLRVMLILRDEFAFSVCACHFNHEIRGIEADNDELFCKKLCESLGVKLYCGCDNVPKFAQLNKMSLEAAARACRYAFFKRIYSKESVDFCATAHNMNDDAETLLLNLVRGSGVNGASSIELYNKYILRPFLKVKRELIDEFLKEIGQEHIVDSTNASIEYTRNYIRKEIFPGLDKINPSVIESFSRYIDSSRIDREYFNIEVEKYFDSDLRDVHEAIRKRVVLRQYKEFSGRILNSDMLNSIDNALFKERRTLIPLFGDEEAIVCNGKVVYSVKNSEACDFQEQTLQMGSNLIFNEKLEIFISESNDDFDTSLICQKDKLNFDAVFGNLKVRTRQVGDKITIKNVNKSVKKLFIDKKIPKEYRDIVPIFYDDKGIIYIPFVGVSDRVFCKRNENGMFFTTVFKTIDKERWSIAHEK